jgi:hypothetical protein
MFQLYDHHQAYLQSLVELYMLNGYGMWDSGSEAKVFLHMEFKNMNHSYLLTLWRRVPLEKLTSLHS